MLFNNDIKIMINKIIGNTELQVATIGVLSTILVAIIAFIRVSYQINKNSKATFIVQCF